MATKVKAVYAGGVFRPLEPYALTDQTLVELTVEPLPPRNVVEETQGLIRINPAIAKAIAEDPAFALWDEPPCP